MSNLYLTGKRGDKSLQQWAKALLTECQAVEATVRVGVSNFADAFKALGTLESDGVCPIASASSEDDALSGLKDALRSVGFAAAIDPDVDRLMATHKAERLTSEGATPEQVFQQVAPGNAAQRLLDSGSTLPGPVYTPPTPPQQPQQRSISNRPAPTESAYQAAICLLVANEGHPLRAAVLACRLVATTGDGPYWQAVLDALMLTQPWIKAPLVAQDFIKSDTPGA